MKWDHYRMAIVAFGAFLVASFAFAPTSPAAPPDEDIAPLTEPLSKTIEVQFLETPLSRVLEFLQRESEITIMLDPEARAEYAGMPVSLEAKKMTVRQALDWSCRAAGADWDIEDKVIFVSDSKSIKRRRLEIRIYDIRGLMLIVQNFRAPDIDIDDALSNTVGGSSGRTLSSSAGGRGGGGGLFGDEDDEVEATTSRAERAEEILELVRSTIGKPDEWEFFGGELNSARVLQGNMVVRTTDTNHQEIEKLLKTIQAALGRMVAVDGRFLLVKSDDVEKLMKQTGGKPVLTANELAAFEEKHLKDGTNIKRLGTARTVCFNTQRVFVTATSGQVFLSGTMPVPDVEGVNPTLSTARNGMVLDVLPTISIDGKDVAAVIRSDVVSAFGFDASAVPTGWGGGGPRITLSGSLSGNMDGQSQPPSNADRREGDDSDTPRPSKITGNVNGNVAGDGTVLPPRPRVSSHLTIEKPKQDLIRHRTTVVIPDGGAVLLSGSSNLLKGVGDKDAEVVLLLRTKIVK